MLALLALIAFVVSIAVYGSIHGWVFWMLLGLALLAADHIYVGLGGTYPRFGRHPR